MEIQFRIRPTTLLQKLYCAYAAKTSVELGNLKLFCDGTVLRPDRTVQECEIEDGDVIDVLSVMVGD